MRKRIRSLTRKQILGYIFLDRFEHIPEQEAQAGLRELTRRHLGDIVISWGYVGTPDDFYRKVRQAKAIARSDDPQFLEFLKNNTKPEDEEAAEAEEEAQLEEAHETAEGGE